MEQTHLATSAQPSEAYGARCVMVAATRKWRTHKPWLALLLSFLAYPGAGCGGGSNAASSRVIVSVSLSSAVVNLTNDGSTVYVPVVIVAPTETASFTISGLPMGVSATYKESESNPSGQLTLSAGTTTLPGTYMVQIIVGSSGQTASVAFTLVVHSH